MHAGSSFGVWSRAVSANPNRIPNLRVFTECSAAECVQTIFSGMILVMQTVRGMSLRGLILNVGSLEAPCVVSKNSWKARKASLPSSKLQRNHLAHRQLWLDTDYSEDCFAIVHQRSFALRFSKWKAPSKRMQVFDPCWASDASQTKLLEWPSKSFNP